MAGRGAGLGLVPAIYRAVTGRDLPLPQDDGAVFGAAERALLAQICAEEDVPVELLMALIDQARDHRLSSSRSRIHERIDEVLQREWRSEREVIAAVETYFPYMEGKASATQGG